LPPKPFGYTVEAAEEATAIEKAAAEFKVPGRDCWRSGDEPPASE
jgi:hypothetical protein